jgi:Flp pilus assembly protein TadD
MRFANIRSFLLAITVSAAVGCDDGPPARTVRLNDAGITKKETSITAPVAVIPTPVAPVVETKPVPSITIPEKYEDQIALGKQLASQGKLEDAKLVFGKAIETDGTKAVPHVELARIALDEKDGKTALKHAEAAVTLEPGSSAAWNTRGRVALVGKDLLGAEKFFERAVLENPDNNYAWNNLGLVRSMQGRFDEAIAALENAVAGPKPEAYMWNNLGLAYEKEDRLEDARVAFRTGTLAGSPVAGKNLARLDAIVTAKVDTLDHEPTDEVKGPEEVTPEEPVHDTQ